MSLLICERVMLEQLDNKMSGLDSGIVIASPMQHWLFYLWWVARKQFEVDLTQLTLISICMRMRGL